VTQTITGTANEFYLLNKSWVGAEALASICDRVLAQDRRIGYAMIVDSSGKLVESRMRGRRLMPQEVIDEYTGLWTVIIRGVTNQMEKHLGAHRFYSLGYEKLTVYGIVLNGKTLVITARNDLPLETALSLKKMAET
jgi:hypothetical protein